MKDEVKVLHKKLIDKKMPHIIAFLEGDMATVIIAGTTRDREGLLEAILSDKGWKGSKDE
jgi:hypothetical protein